MTLERPEARAEAAAIRRGLALPVHLPAVPPAARAWARRFAAALAAHRLYLLGILGYWAACLALAPLLGAEEVVSIRPYTVSFLMLAGVFALAALLGRAVWMMVVVRPEGSLTAAIAADLARRFLAPGRLAYIVAAIGPAPLFITTFGSFKRMIPYLSPFAWDPEFMEWDKALHGGRHAWELLQPVLGAPLITSALNANYNLWFFVVLLSFIWQAASRRRPALRMRFLVSFLACWILLGTILAAVFASAGPVYYGRVTGLADSYAPLMQYLHGVEAHYPVWSLKVQELLWQTYQSRGATLGGGISAMPSLHVATSVLLALLGWKINRLAGVAYSLFALAIFLGSVHLGWHYAIDGYVAAIAAVAIWAAAGRWLRAG